MRTITAFLEHGFVIVLNMSVTASVAILAVLVLRAALRRAPRIFSYALWAVVLFRLLCPFSFTSDVSLLGLWPEETAVRGRMVYIPEDIARQETTAAPVSAPSEPAAITAPRPDASAAVTADDNAKAGASAADASTSGLWLRIGSCVWAAGSLILLSCGVVSYIRLRRQLRRAVPAPDPDIRGRALLSGRPWRRAVPAPDPDIRGRALLSGRLYRISGFGTPFVCGLIRPKIYIPSDIDTEHADYMILHERIHIRRGDHIFRLLACLALCLHWFNPLVWLACVLSGRDMEMSCDEAVLRKSGTDIKKAYSASLLTLAAGQNIMDDDLSRRGQPRADALHGNVLRGVPLAFGEREPESRIKNVLRYRKPAAATAAVVCLICLLASVLLLANPGSRQPDSSDSSGPPVLYGIVQTAGGAAGGGTVLIPGFGEMTIPDAQTVEPYIEIDFHGLEPGHLVQITFPDGTDAGTLIAEAGESGPDADNQSGAAGLSGGPGPAGRPGTFSCAADSIHVMGTGFSLIPLENGSYLFSVPIGMARNAKEGDTLLFFRPAGGTDVPEGGETGLAPAVLQNTDDAAEAVSFARARVEAVDAGQYDIWVILSAEETAAFLSGFGSGVFCELEPAEAVQPLTADLLQAGSIPDGSYLIYPESISLSARGFDRCAVPDYAGTQEDASAARLLPWPETQAQPFLAFADDCTFLVNQSFEGVRYREADFDEFARLLSDGLSYMNPPVHAVFSDGRISRASLESAFYKAGISCLTTAETDSWYDDLPRLTGLESSQALETYYQPVRTVTADVSDARGAEQIDIYTGNIGDGDGGLVLIRNENGELIHTLSAHCARAGWNNIYAGELDEVGFLLTVRIEDRDTFREYSYRVFRLGEDGAARLIAGSSFTFSQDRIDYEDESFREWCRNLETWLVNSRLLLSSQDGELRTEAVSDAERYSYRTLKP